MMKKKVLILALIWVICIGNGALEKAFGASVSARASGGSCKVGGTVTVSITYSGDDFGAATATLSYDSSILELKSYGGAITMANGNEYLLEATGATSMKGTFTFKAKAAGSTTVKISTSSGTTWTSEENFSCGTASAVVTVSASTSTSGGTASSGSSGSSGGKSPSGTNGRGDFNESNEGLPEPEEIATDPSVRPEAIEVTIGGKAYIICEDIDETTLPDGFKTVNIQYGEYKWEIPVAGSEESKYTLIRLKETETGEEDWFFYDTDTGEISKSRKIGVEEALEYERLSAEGEDEKTWFTSRAATGLAAVLAIAVVVLLIIQIRQRKKKS